MLAITITLEDIRALILEVELEAGIILGIQGSLGTISTIVLIFLDLQDLMFLHALSMVMMCLLVRSATREVTTMQFHLSYNSFIFTYVVPNLLEIWAFCNSMLPQG